MFKMLQKQFISSDQNCREIYFSEEKVEECSHAFEVLVYWYAFKKLPMIFLRLAPRISELILLEIVIKPT